MLQYYNYFNFKMLNIQVVINTLKTMKILEKNQILWQISR